MRLKSLLLLSVALLTASCAGHRVALHSWYQDVPPDDQETETVAEEAPVPGRSRVLKKGLYVGIRLGDGALGDDLDGESALVGPSDLIVLPAFEDGSIQGFSVGGVGEGSSIELYYDKGEHDGDFSGLAIEGTLRSCGFRGRHAFYRNESFPRLAPHFLWGMGVHNLSIHNGSTNGVLVGDGELFGIGFDIGLGASFAVHRHVALNADYFLRCITFTSASGVIADDVSLADNLDSIEPVLLFGLDFVF